MKVLGITSSILVILSVFLPWVETSSISFEINDVSFNIKDLYGISTSFGKLGLSLGIISVLMFYYERKLSLLPGYAIVFFGLIYIFEIIQGGETSSSSSGNYSSTVSYICEIQIGMYLFIVGGIFCIISGFKFLKLDSKIWSFS